MPDEIKFGEVELSAEQAAALAIATLIEGASPSTWTSRTGKKLLERLMDNLRVSLARGDDLGEAITAVFGGVSNGVPTTGITNQAKREAASLTSTAIAAVANAARLQTFQQNADVIKGIQQVSILDNRTSKICIAYSGQSWDIETLEPIFGSTLRFNGGPPRHFNCRSTLVPILRSWEALGLTGLTDRDKKRLSGQPPGDITLDQWLRGKSKSQQDKLLGPARARLWRSGAITLTQLVDMRGNPLNLEQLAKKIQRRRRR